MNEIKVLLSQLKQKVEEESWKEAVELCKQINALVEPSLKRDKYQWVYNCTKAFSESFPTMLMYTKSHEKREKFKSIYNNFHVLYLTNVSNLETYFSAKAELTTT